MTVVAARELDDGIASGGAAGETDRRHHRLGAGGNESNHFQVWNCRHYEIGQLYFLATRSAKAETGGSGRRHRLDDVGVGVAKNQRAPRTDVVDIAVAIGVEDVAAEPPLVEERVAADRAKGANG